MRILTAYTVLRTVSYTWTKNHFADAFPKRAVLKLTSRFTIERFFILITDGYVLLVQRTPNCAVVALTALHTPFTEPVQARNCRTVIIHSRLVAYVAQLTPNITCHFCLTFGERSRMYEYVNVNDHLCSIAIVFATIFCM